MRNNPLETGLRIVSNRQIVDTKRKGSSQVTQRPWIDLNEEENPNPRDFHPRHFSYHQVLSLAVSVQIDPEPITTDLEIIAPEFFPDKGPERGAMEFKHSLIVHKQMDQRKWKENWMGIGHLDRKTL